MTIKRDLRPPDIVLSVRERVIAGDQRRLRYRLTTVAGHRPASRGSRGVRSGTFAWDTFESRTFGRDARRLTFFREALQSLRSPAGGAPIGSREARGRLLGASRALTERLVPEAIAEQLGRAGHRGASGDRPSLLIVSDVSWVPFEALLVRSPRRGKTIDEENGPDARQGFGEEHWAQAFAMSRWTPHRPCRRALRLDRRAWVEGHARDLPDVLRERQQVHRVADESIENLARLDTLREALETGSHDVVHFVGHAEVDPHDPESWRFPLGAHQSLTAADVKGLGPALRTRAPLVFLNVCSSSLGGASWGEPAGMASSFIEAGARAVVGASWPINDAFAADFAAAFFAALEADRPLGEAAHEAREAIRKHAPDDATWLAYTVYGHPLAHIGAHEDAVDLTLTSPESLIQFSTRAITLTGLLLVACLTWFVAWPREGDDGAGMTTAQGAGSAHVRPATPSREKDTNDTPETTLASGTFEVYENALTLIEMIPARLSVRFSELEGKPVFTITVHRPGATSIEETFFIEGDQWVSFTFDASNERWSARILNVDVDRHCVEVMVLEESK